MVISLFCRGRFWCTQRQVCGSELRRSRISLVYHKGYKSKKQQPLKKLILPKIVWITYLHRLKKKQKQQILIPENTLVLSLQTDEALQSISIQFFPVSQVISAIQSQVIKLPWYLVKLNCMHAIKYRNLHWELWFRKGYKHYLTSLLLFLEILFWFYYVKELQACSQFFEKVSFLSLQFLIVSNASTSDLLNNTAFWLAASLSILPSFCRDLLTSDSHFPHNQSIYTNSLSRNSPYENW